MSPEAKCASSTLGYRRHEKIVDSAAAAAPPRHGVRQRGLHGSEVRARTHDAGQSLPVLFRSSRGQVHRDRALHRHLPSGRPSFRGGVRGAVPRGGVRRRRHLSHQGILPPAQRVQLRDRGIRFAGSLQTQDPERGKGSLRQSRAAGQRHQVENAACPQIRPAQGSGNRPPRTLPVRNRRNRPVQASMEADRSAKFPHSPIGSASRSVRAQTERKGWTMKCRQLRQNFRSAVPASLTETGSSPPSRAASFRFFASSAPDFPSVVPAAGSSRPHRAQTETSPVIFQPSRISFFLAKLSSLQ